MRHVAFTFLGSHLIVVAMGLAIDKQCGKVICSGGEYCSIFNEQCEKCSDICDTNTHNYDQQHCAAYCRDYSENAALSGEIDEIRRTQNVTLVLMIVLLAIVLIKCGLRLIKWARNQPRLSSCFSTKVKKSKPTNVHSEPTVNSKPRPDGSQIFSMSGADGSVVQTVSTPISTRYPTENSTTEYSYDNAAMQVSPGHKGTGTETTF